MAHPISNPIDLKHCHQIPPRLLQVFTSFTAISSRIASAPNNTVLWYFQPNHPQFTPPRINPNSPNRNCIIRWLRISHEHPQPPIMMMHAHVSHAHAHVSRCQTCQLCLAWRLLVCVVVVVVVEWVGWMGAVSTAVRKRTIIPGRIYQTIFALQSLPAAVGARVWRHSLLPPTADCRHSTFDIANSPHSSRSADQRVSK